MLYLVSYLVNGPLISFAVPQTPLYIHTRTDSGPAAFGESAKILQKKYEGRQMPSGDLAQDEKTLETASSTLLAAALNPELDGTYIANERILPMSGSGTNAKCLLIRKFTIIPQELSTL